MYIECWVIIAILLMVAYMFMRTGRKGPALATLPLAIVPFVHILSGYPARLLSNALNLPYPYLKMSFAVLAVVISCTIFGAISRKIPAKAVRRVYLGMCIGFSLILTLVLIYNTIH